MSDFDLILRRGVVNTDTESYVADVGIAEGRIAAVTPLSAGSLSGRATEEIHIPGLFVFPGLIDAHVHFNEPGRTDWEGIHSGSSALAAGGGALFFDMPLNAHPPTLDAASFNLKRQAAEKSALTDFALWGGLVPENLDHLEELADCGVIGFKAFMSSSGIADFSRADNATLREGMKRAGKLGQLVAVHAENEALTQSLTQAKIAAGQVSIRDYLDSRPVAAELEAIRRAIDMAGETGCALHIVHVSSGAGVELVTAARSAGADVTCETCPHYLVLTEEDMEKLGASAKCAPPLRPGYERENLWQHLLAGEVTTIGSDHSPAPPDLKMDANFFKVWGGISGVQHTLPLLLTEGFRRNIPYPRIVQMTSTDVARRFRLPSTKGKIAVGADADLAIVNITQRFTVRPEDLYYRHKQTPYAGRSLTGKVVQTILRGQTIYKDGRIASLPMGRLVKPQR
jgi:allantoinase